jgi:hypothetical protein
MAGERSELRPGSRSRRPVLPDAKLRTAIEILHPLGPEAEALDLRFTGPDGAEYRGVQLILVPNNRYELDPGRRLFREGINLPPLLTYSESFPLASNSPYLRASRITSPPYYSAQENERRLRQCLGHGGAPNGSPEHSDVATPRGPSSPSRMLSPVVPQDGQ